MFELFEHKADMGVRGIGKTKEEAFEECAKAMFSVMAELENVEKTDTIQVNIVATDINALLVKWLNELLYLNDIHRILFSNFRVLKLFESTHEFYLQGLATGEKINFGKHKLKVEVKAATYSGLKVVEENGKWVAQCIVDV